jgi:hypothetical protein
MVMTMSDADWLEQAARYFEKRPTGGEDMAFWANVANAERCRSIAATLRASSGVEVKGLETAPSGPAALEPDEINVHEGAWALIIGTNGKPAGWVDTHAAFAHRLYRDQILRADIASPLTTVEVTEEMVLAGARGIWRAGNTGLPFELAPPAVVDGLMKQSRAAITAALSQNKGE